MMDAFRTAGQAVTAAPLKPVEVLGIDETRRGRTRWRQNPDTLRWEPVANQWHTGFVDAFGTQGRLGQVEGRAPSDVLAWLSTTPPRSAPACRTPPWSSTTSTWSNSRTRC
ncbi:hypothetical protein [Streptomyces hainanensis]|uniref:hypothetical protein n=1 Tax=Streptomyces hainanensis TaxID=402648 RepID=UPI00140491E9|nr:hypothetical protein [Streptomyces hainanensis]